MQYLYHLKTRNSGGAGTKGLLTHDGGKARDLEFTTGKAENSEQWLTLNLVKTTNTNTSLFDLSFTTASYGRELNQTQIATSEFYPVPLAWLSSISQLPAEYKTFDSTAEVINTQQFGTFLYLVTARSGDVAGTLVLPQSFDQGWLAVNIQTKQPLTPHVTYNGWGKAWKLPEGESQIVIVYWPQLLSYFGYVGFAGAVLSLCYSWLKK